MITLKKLFVIATTGMLLATLSLKADQLTLGDAVQVKEVGVSPGKVVNITSSTLGTLNVWAGVTNLLVDGIAFDSFCIDPFQYSSGAYQSYVVTDLAAAPQSPYTMGAAAAVDIKNLWALYYSTSITANAAAGLQIAIWEIVGGSNFTVNGSDYGAAGMIASLASYSSGGANLVALSSSTYQDYVVQNVPDSGTTLLLLGLGLVGLAVAGRRYQRA